MLIAILAFAAAGIGADADAAADLLRRTASVYDGIHDYVIEVRFRSAGAALGASLPFGGPANTMLLARSGAAFRLEFPNRLIWITDGRTTWRYRPGRNKYSETPAEPWPAVPGAGPEPPGYEWAYFTKFRALPSVARQARILKANVPPDKLCPNSSVWVEIGLSDDKVEPASERLRIDRITGLVYESIIHRRTGGLGGVSEYEKTTEWRYLQTSGSVDPRLFTFFPPKKTKRVKDPDSPW